MGLAAGSCTSQHTCCIHWMNSHEKALGRQTVALGGATSEVQLDSSHCMTAVACRLGGGGGAS